MRYLLMLGCMIVLISAALAASPSAPLHDAARRADVAGVQAALEADPTTLNAQNLQGLTPLQIALGSEDRMHRPLPPARLAIAKLLIESGADVTVCDYEGNTPLHNAIQQGAAELVPLLIGLRADVNATSLLGMTPLMQAAVSKRTDFAKQLLAAGALVDSEAVVKRTALHMAAQTDLALVKLLVEAGADPLACDAFGMTPLQLAIEARQADTVIYLLGLPKRAPLDGRDTLGQPPLVAAWMRGDVAVADVLVAAGAPLDMGDYQQRTALYYAAQKGDVQRLGNYLARGANPNIATVDGQTPLFVADNLVIAQALIRAGADPKVRDVRGWTALHQTGDQGVAAALLAAGADINARSYAGETPMALARSLGKPQILDWLKMNGGRE